MKLAKEKHSMNTFRFLPSPSTQSAAKNSELSMRLHFDNGSTRIPAGDIDFDDALVL
jgi:hypothetical protein